MKKPEMKYAWLLLLACLFMPLHVTDATASRMNQQDVYQLLKSANRPVVQSLAVGEREILLATIAMNQGKTKQALGFLTTDVVKDNRLAALMRAEAYRRQSVQAADRAGRYAHAVNDDIGVLKEARITAGLDEANRRLELFIVKLNAPKARLSKPVVHKPVVTERVRPQQLVAKTQSVRPVAPKQTVVVQPVELVRPAPTVTALPKSIVEVSRPVVVNVAKPKPVKLKLAKLRPIEVFPIKVIEKRPKPAQVKPVRVKSTVVTSSSASNESLSQSVHKAIEAWRNDWESRDSAAYLSHYHQAFKTLKHDYNSWVKYKRRVNGKKSYINVDLSEINIIPSAEPFQGGEAVLVIFKQRYQSSNFNASSRKQLYMARKSSVEPWLILYEGDGS